MPQPYKMTLKFIYNFLSNLSNRQTKDRQRDKQTEIKT